MVAIGTITGQQIISNRDGVEDVRLLQVRLSNDSDIQTVQYMPMSGDDSPPQNGDLVVVVAIGPAFQVALGVQDSVVPSMQTGEKKLYSRDSGGIIAAFINFMADGNLELNGKAFTAVRFANLETAFNQLKTDLNSHLHTNPEGGSVGPSTPQSTADISSAESVTVKLL